MKAELPSEPWLLSCAASAEAAAPIKQVLLPLLKRSAGSLHACKTCPALPCPTLTACMLSRDAAVPPLVGATSSRATRP